MRNQDAVRRLFDEVVNKGNVELVDELFDPEFTTKTPDGTFDRAGFKEYVVGWRAGFPDVHCEVSEFVEEGDKVAWKVRATGTHTGDFMGIPPTGRSTDFDSINIATFRDGKALRHEVVMDTMTLMTQLGLVPEPQA